MGIKLGISKCSQVSHPGQPVVSSMIPHIWFRPAWPQETKNYVVVKSCRMSD